MTAPRRKPPSSRRVGQSVGVLLLTLAAGYWLLLSVAWGVGAQPWGEVVGRGEATIHSCARSVRQLGLIVECAADLRFSELDPIARRPAAEPRTLRSARPVSGTVPIELHREHRRGSDLFHAVPRDRPHWPGGATSYLLGIALPGMVLTLLLGIAVARRVARRPERSEWLGQ